jgi:hypothetical protein
MTEAERLLARLAKLNAMQAALETYLHLIKPIKPTRKEGA